MTNRVMGSCSAPVAASTPPIQKNGMAHRIRAGASDPVTDRMALGHVEVCRTTVPWVCSTPLGSAVDPEVCTMIARSAGVTSSSTAVSTSGGTTSAVSPSQRVAHSRSGSPVSTIRRR
jgi:hypothetical protein